MFFRKLLWNSSLQKKMSRISRRKSRSREMDGLISSLEICWYASLFVHHRPQCVNIIIRANAGAMYPMMAEMP